MAGPFANRPHAAEGPAAFPPMTSRLLGPLDRDEMMCVCHSLDAGVFEWICGEDAASDLLNGGMQRINGKPCHVEVVGFYPELAGTQIRATVSEVTFQ